MVSTHVDDMTGEIALAIEMGANAVDIGKAIYPHPTLGESIDMAAEVADALGFSSRKGDSLSIQTSFERCS